MSARIRDILIDMHCFPYSRIYVHFLVYIVYGQLSEIVKCYYCNEEALQQVTYFYIS